ncbi:MAG: hypothetical protein NXI21_18255 [Alphaproteobacteria bacterium]|nr:hypothetical protein [Alphaproteobacteria bacterium]
MADMKTIDDPMDLGAVTAADFEPHLDELFEVPAGDVSVALRLIQVKETPAYAHPNATRTPFTLVFRGETEGALLNGDGGYVLRREGFGRIEAVLITPIVSQDPASGAMFYQICLT